MKDRRRIQKRRRRRNRRKRLLICALAELLAFAVLGIMLYGNRGIGYRVANIVGIFARPAVENVDLSGLKSQEAVLMDVKSGDVIGELNADEQMYPASMTKVMTAIVAMESISNLNREITMPYDIYDALYREGASQAGFLAGETVTARDLLYGVMLPSGAECCLALAEDISGSEEAFVEKMNEKAKKLGMESTHFCDTTGLHNPDHYSTARDIAVLMRYALHNSTFVEIAESASHTSDATDLHPDGLTYYSTLFKYISDASVTGGEILGGKTGYTGEAGHCLASFAEIDGRMYILVTAGAFDGTNQTPHIQDAFTVYNRLGAAVE